MSALKYTVLLFFFLSATQIVFSQDIKSGFTDHGVASPFSNSRGTVATVDGDGRNVVLVWLFDHRGGYALLMIDAETGKSEQFPTPFIFNGDSPFSSILSGDNKYYTLFNGHFVEFDPAKRAFTFHHKSLPRVAMGMTQDDHGVIWAATFPNGGLVSFNPETREFKDHGYVYKQNWNQYPRHVAADDTGWIYFGLGNTASQIIAFDPVSGTTKPMLKESERKRGIAYVYRHTDGKVYGKSLENENGEWLQFYKGNLFKVNEHTFHPKPVITANQDLFHRVFPDGKRLEYCDLNDRELSVKDMQSLTSKKVRFTYETEGSWVLGVGASPDGTICGGASFPMRFFSFNPKTNTWVNRPALGQFNALASQAGHLFFGGYPRGFLLEWDPSEPWVRTRRNDPDSNPVHLVTSTPVIHRPHRLMAYPDGKTVIMGGTPEYGYTGGGLLFWDREKGSQTLLTDSNVIVNQSTTSLVALPGGKLLGGTTTSPGTGGEKKAKEAELYVMDVASKRLEWHRAVLPDVQTYSDMCQGPNGLIYGIINRRRFFVFDPVKREVIHEQAIAENLGETAAEQSPRIFVFGPQGEIYILCIKGIGLIDPQSFNITLIAESPVPIKAGGDYLDGRIYFMSGSHLYSYQLATGK